jgi:hypothetical protein
LWIEWRHSQAEDALQSLAFDYEEKYFPDLRLLEAPIRRRLLEYEDQRGQGQWVTMSDDYSVDIDGWIFHLEDVGCLGKCDYPKKTIFIKPGLDEIEYRATLLHELTHAYESQLTLPFREWLLLYIHERMKKRIGLRKLQKYTDSSTHILVHHAAHGELFLSILVCVLAGSWARFLDMAEPTILTRPRETATAAFSRTQWPDVGWSDRGANVQAAKHGTNSNRPINPNRLERSRWDSQRVRSKRRPLGRI